MKQPTIGIDLNTFSNKYAGIGRYTMNLVQHLVERNKFSYLGYPSPNTDNSALLYTNLKAVKGLTSRIKSTVLRSMLLFPFQTKLDNIDLFHSTDSSSINLLPNSKCKRVSTIHDVIVFKHPEFFTKKHMVIAQKMITNVTRKADHIIADSQSTKKDLLEVFPKLKEDDISVIYLAASDKFQKAPTNQIEDFKIKYHLPERYFLSLATHEPRKNLRNLITAFRKLKRNSAFEDIGLVLVGGKGWLDSGVDETIESYKKDRIIPLGFIEDNHLSNLYSGAIAFAYPSLYEGFGLPVLEAMSCGRPIITSHISSIPEIAGKSAIYVDPYSIESIRNALQNIAENSDLREKLSKEAIQKRNEFAWEKTAKQTEKVYKMLFS